MKHRRFTWLTLAAILIVACTCPAIAVTGTSTPPTASSAPAATGAVPSAEAPTVTATVSSAATACTPLLTANTNANVRTGPGIVYNEIGALLMNQTATIDGKNAEGTWWRIVFPAGPGGHGWVAASVSTATCASAVAAVVPPATPTEEIPIGVTSVSVSVDPKTLGFPGCVGPIQQSTAFATITVNGPFTLKYHFETDQLGSLPTHTLTFSDAGSKDVSEKFTPVLTAGTYWVRLSIEDVDLGGMDYQAKYKITC